LRGSSEEPPVNHAIPPVAIELLKIPTAILTWWLIEELKRWRKRRSKRKRKESEKTIPTSTATINRNIFFENLSDGILEAFVAGYFIRSLIRYAASSGPVSRPDVVAIAAISILAALSSKRAARYFGTAIVAIVRMKRNMAPELV